MHDESNLGWKVHKFNCKKVQLSLNCYGAIGTFTDGFLRIIDNDKDFTIEDMIVEEVKRLSDNVMQSINNKEDNAGTDA